MTTEDRPRPFIGLGPQEQCSALNSGGTKRCILREWHSGKHLFDKWEGSADRECGEHRTCGARAWCYDCREWCYDDWLCIGCEIGSLRKAVERYRNAWRSARRRAAVRGGLNR